MATIAPKALNGVYGLIAPYFQTDKRGGIVNPNSPGYHTSREDLKRQGRTADYSIQCPADKRGNAQHAAGIDITFGSVAELITMHKRLRAACTPNSKGDYDPRIECVREIIGTLDGKNVSGYNRVATGSAARSKVGWVSSGYSDSSHLWHEHVSVLRDRVDNVNDMAGLAEVMAGLAKGKLGWKDPDAPVVVPPKFLPPYVVSNPDGAWEIDMPSGELLVRRLAGYRITDGVRIDTLPNGQWLVRAAVDGRGNEHRLHMPNLALETAVPVVPKPTFTKIAHIDPPGVGNWQGAGLTNGHWYVMEARKESDRENCYVYRFPLGANPTMTEKPMKLQAEVGGKIHPTGWGASDAGVLWLTWNDTAEGNDVVTVTFAAGKTVLKSQTQQMHTFTEGNAQVAFCSDNVMVSVRVLTATTDTHTLRTKQDVLDGVDKPLGVVKISRKATRTVQGFTLVTHGGAWELRVLTGLKSADSPYTLERYNAETGKHIATIPLPELGREPEGIDSDVLGFKTADRGGLDVFRYTV